MNWPSAICARASTSSMWPSAMCSEARGRPVASRRAALRVALFLPALSLVPGAGIGQPTLAQEEALRLAFPEPAVIERRTAYLSPDEIERAAELAGPGVDVDASLVTHYVGSLSAGPLGVAYFDAHRVRTLSEVLMIVISPVGDVERIEVLKFGEPPEYRAPEGWLAQFYGEELSDAVSLKDGIANMSGASLTSQAITDAVRRVLALHEVIQPLAPGKGR